MFFTFKIPDFHNQINVISFTLVRKHGPAYTDFHETHQSELHYLLMSYQNFTRIEK
jgi:hypothetical protein